MSQPLFILSVIAAYLLIWMAVAFFTSRGADNSTFFSGGRKMPWPLVAIAMIGAPISGVTFISVPGMAVAKGYSYLQMGLGFITGYLLIAFVLIPVYYRFNIISVYGYLERRFGSTTSKTGAWLFFVSKLLGISVRFLVVCAMLQLLIFEPLGVSYLVSVAVSLLFIWATTFRGGVKSVIWGDVLKSFCLISAIILCLVFIASNLGLSPLDIPSRIMVHESSRMFFFDDPSDAKFFWKQFVAGIFLVIAMTGLDQDMMQRTLACRNARDSRKNLMVSSVMQFVVMACLLLLGTMMILFSRANGLDIPEKSDNLFASVAFAEGIPVIVGVLFVLGLVSATFSSVGSALTAMTTTMTVDILEAHKSCSPSSLTARRHLVHLLVSLSMAVLVVFFYYLNSDDALSMVYTLVSYSDGPILGLFVFGLFTRRDVNESLLPVVCLLAPILSWALQWCAGHFLDYTISFELLIINAALTFCGLWLLSKPAPSPEASGAIDKPASL